MIVHKYHRHEGTPQYIDSRLELDHNKIMYLINNPIYKDLSEYEGDLSLAKHSLPLYFWGDLRDRSTIYLKENYGIRSALILDYDKDVLISDWFDRYEGEFEFYIYTSFSNTLDNHKFRVIIPTKQNYYMSDELKECIFEDFPGLDPTSLDNRGFYAPGYHDANLYACTYSASRKFDMVDRYYEKMTKLIQAYDDIPKYKQDRPLCTDYDREFHQKCILKKAKDKLDSVSWNISGGRFLALRSIFYYLYSRRDIVDKYEAESLFNEYNFESKQERQLKGFFRSW